MEDRFSSGKHMHMEQARLRMQESFVIPTWSQREKLALTCRILFSQGHDSGLAGQVTAIRVWIRRNDDSQSAVDRRGLECAGRRRYGQSGESISLVDLSTLARCKLYRAHPPDPHFRALDAEKAAQDFSHGWLPAL
jgi:hypothetical protein